MWGPKKLNVESFLKRHQTQIWHSSPSLLHCSHNENHNNIVWSVTVWTTMPNNDRHLTHSPKALSVSQQEMCWSISSVWQTARQSRINNHPLNRNGEYGKNKWREHAVIVSALAAPSYDFKVNGINLLSSEVCSIIVVSLYNHVSTTNLQLQRALVYQ